MVVARSQAEGFPKNYHIIIIDNGLPTKRIWKEFTPIITDSSNKNECLKKIKEYLNNNSQILCPKEYDSEILKNFLFKALDQEITEEISWLSTDKGFEVIHEIFMQNRFIFIQQDFTHVEFIDRLNTILKDNNLISDVLWISSIEYYITQFSSSLFASTLSLGRFKAGMRILLNSQTLLVDIKPVDIEKKKEPSSSEKKDNDYYVNFLKQRVQRGNFDSMEIIYPNNSIKAQKMIPVQNMQSDSESTKTTLKEEWPF